MKLQEFSEAFMKEPQNGFRKGQSCTDSTFCLKLLFLRESYTDAMQTSILINNVSNGT